MTSAAVDVLGDGRLLKRVLQEGTGQKPLYGSQVSVMYETFIAASGRRIDAVTDRTDSFIFMLGWGDVVEAWDYGIATMLPGEKAEFLATADIAYGDSGAGEDIPPNASLRFVVELIGEAAVQETMGGSSASDAPVARSPDAGDDNLARAQQLKERGNELVKSGDYRAAMTSYKEALRLLLTVNAPTCREQRGTGMLDRPWKDDPDRKEEAPNEDLQEHSMAKALRISVLLNLALCELKSEDFASATRSASQVLELDPDNCKALFRRASALLARASHLEAKADLMQALRIAPNSTEIRHKLEEVRSRMQDSDEWQKIAYGGVFGRSPEQRLVRRDLDDLPRVWLAIQIGAEPPKRLYIALYSDTVPRTAENFRALCTGEKGLGLCGQPLHYKETLVHRIVPKSLIEAGDIENYDGSGGESIYGRSFQDEAFEDQHHRRGLLSMASRTPHSNDSRFFITLRSLPQFDRKHVVFGEVIENADLLDRIEMVETTYPDKPVVQVAIVDSGEAW